MGQGFDLIAVPQPQVVPADAPSGLDGGGFDDQQSGAACGAGRVVSYVPI
jgi:hypothetical protein